MDAESQAAPTAGQRAAHLEAAAAAVCQRCGAFLCEAVEKSAGASCICAACQDRLANRPPSHEAIAALVLAALGPFGVVPGLVGGVFGWRELRRIRRGEAAASGEGYARLAQGLGVLYAFVTATGVLWLVARLVE